MLQVDTDFSFSFFLHSVGIVPLFNGLKWSIKRLSHQWRGGIRPRSSEVSKVNQISECFRAAERVESRRATAQYSQDHSGVNAQGTLCLQDTFLFVNIVQSSPRAETLPLRDSALNGFLVGSEWGNMEM